MVNKLEKKCITKIRSVKEHVCTYGNKPTLLKAISTKDFIKTISYKNMIDCIHSFSKHE